MQDSTVRSRMVVGTLRVRLMVRGAQSLKDKRQVVRSIKDRMSSSFNVSVAEVESEEHRQLITLGFAMVSNEVTHARIALEKIVAALRSHPIAEFIDSQIEV